MIIKFMLDQGMKLVGVLQYGAVSIGKSPSTHIIIKFSRLFVALSLGAEVFSDLISTPSWLSGLSRVAGNTPFIIRTGDGSVLC